MGLGLFGSAYVMRNAAIRGGLHVVVDEPMSRSDQLSIVRGVTTPSMPLGFHHSEGRKLSDFLSASYVGFNLVSNRVVELFRANAFSGWSTFPVSVRGRSGESLSGYHGLAVTGRCGHIDESMSKCLECGAPSPSGKRYRRYLGMYFREETWDKCDVFGPDDSSFVFVVEKVKGAIEAAGLTNVMFQRLDEFVMETVS